MPISVAASADDVEVSRIGSAVYPPNTADSVAAAGSQLFVDRSFAVSSYSVAVALIRWDTSVIPVGAVIVGASLRVRIGNLRLSADARSLVGEWYPATNWPIDASDYTDVPSNTALAGVPISGIAADTSYDWPLVDAATNINRSGYTAIRLHISGGVPSGSNYVSVRAFDDSAAPEPQLLLTLAKSVGDSGAGAEGATSLMALTAVSESGAGDESTSASVSVVAGDGFMSEGGSVDIGGAYDPTAGTGRATEVVSILATLTSADAGAGGDSGLLTVLAAVADTGAAQEAVQALVSAGITDSGAGLDAVLDILNFHVFVRTDGTVEPFGVILLRGGEPDISPELRDYTETVPGRPGELHFGSDYGPRGLELRVASQGSLSVAQKEALKRYVAQWLRPTLGAFSIAFEDDITKYLEVRLSGRISVDEEYASWLRFTIPLKASNPFYLGSTLRVQTGSGTVTSEGTADAPATVKITGPVNNPSVTVGDRTFTWTGSVGSLDELVIDGDRMTVTFNGVNALAGFSGEFPEVQPGDNTITAAAGGTTTVTWRDRWV